VIDSHHYTERFQLLIIVALGETIVVTGNLLSREGIAEPAQLTSLVVSFLTTVALWWLYFDVIAPGSKHTLSKLDDPSIAARNAFVYLHLPIVAGIIAMAVAFELMVAHPNDALHGWELGVAIAGPFLYLAGHNGVRRVFDNTWSSPRWVTAGAILLLATIGGRTTSLQLMSSILGMLTVLTVWEAISYRRWFATADDPDVLVALEHLGR
jgi:low temperature requirement protein LtrA